MSQPSKVTALGEFPIVYYKSDRVFIYESEVYCIDDFIKCEETEDTVIEGYTHYHMTYFGEGLCINILPDKVQLAHFEE